MMTKDMVKCHFKKATDAEKLEFKNSGCLLTISVGQESHEGQRFTATMRLIHNHFNSCVISLHDSLQRYTMSLNQEGDADDYYCASIITGDEWLARNVSSHYYFERVVKVIRWDDYLNDPDFPTQKNRILTTLATDPSYHLAFENTIDDYLARYRRRLENPFSFNLVRARKLCFDYLVEECAVLCLWSKLGCQFELYTGKHNVAMEETRRRFLNSFNLNSVQGIQIGFNHRSDLQPQQFKMTSSKQDRMVA